MTERRYRILGRLVSLASDRTDLLDLFEADYGRFRKSRNTGGGFDLALAARLDADPPILEIRSADSGPGRVRTIRLPDARSRFVMEIIQREVLRALPEYLFLHAAVAVREGGAMAVSGPSGAGKTTLLLRLIREGFGIFSDEFAPIHLETSRVAPFPRALAVRVRRDDPMRRRAIDPVTLGNPPSRRPVPLRQLAFLETEPSSDDPGSISLVIESGRTRRLLHDLGRGGWARTRRLGDGSYDWVVIPPSGERAERIRVLKALNAHRDAILHVRGREVRRGAFGREPALTRLSAAEAAPLFMAQLVDNACPWLVESPGEAFFRICGILRGISCWRVRCGTPARTASALAAAWREAAPRRERARKGRGMP